DEPSADHERLGESLRPRLHVVHDAEPELTAVAEQALKRRLVFRRRNDEDVPDAGEHQRRERVVNHRLVVDRDELLAESQGQRIEPCPRTAREDDAFHETAEYTT